MIDDAFQLYYSTQLVQRSVQALEAMLLQSGDVFTALVKDVPAPQTYLLNIQGIMFSLDIPLKLQVGDQINLRVRENTPEKMVLDIAYPRTDRTSDPGQKTSSLPTIPSRAIDEAPVPPAPSLAPSRMDAGGLLRHLTLPANEEHVQAVQQLIRFEAPVNRDTIQSLVQTARDYQKYFPQSAPAKIMEPLAFLIARDLEPAPDLVRSFIPMTRPGAPVVAMPENIMTGPPRDASTPARPAAQEDVRQVLQAIAKTIQKVEQSAARMPPTAASLEQTAHAITPKSILPEEIASIVRDVLQKTPPLQTLDRLVTLLSRSLPETAAKIVNAEPVVASQPIPAEVVSEIKSLIQDLPPELARRLKAAVPELDRFVKDPPPELLQKLKIEVDRMEREEISRNPRLQNIREAFQIISKESQPMEVPQRLVANHILNQLSQIRQDGVVILDLPVAVSGEPTPHQMVHVRVFDRSKGRSDQQSAGTLSLALNLTLSALGTVWVQATVAAPRVGIRFRVRHAGHKKLFEQNRNDLSRALEPMGYTTSIQVETSGEAAPEPSVMDLFQRNLPNDPYFSIDIVV